MAKYQICCVSFDFKLRCVRYSYRVGATAALRRYSGDGTKRSRPKETKESRTERRGGDRLSAERRVLYLREPSQ